MILLQTSGQMDTAHILPFNIQVKEFEQHARRSDRASSSCLSETVCVAFFYHGSIFCKDFVPQPRVGRYSIGGNGCTKISLVTFKGKLRTIVPP